MNTSNSSVKHKKGSKVKCQYSGGFRNFHPPVKAEKKEQKKTVQEYVQKLGIINLPSHYESFIDNNRVKTEQKAQGWINRLYENESRKKKKQGEQENNAGQQKKEDDKDRGDIYKVDEHFEKKALGHMLQKQIEKTYSRLMMEYKGRGQQNKNISFRQLLSTVIIKHSQQLNTHQQLIMYFKSTLKQKVDATREELKSNSITITKQKIQQLKYNLPLLYFIITQPTEYYLNYDDLTAIIRNDMQSSKLSFQNVPTNFSKNYTVPFKVPLNQVHQTKVTPKVAQQFSHTVKANPIPKSTYDQPKQHKAKQNKTTQIKPFNITEKGSQAPTFQEYYQWQRNFKPTPLPSTTYNPQKIKLNHQNEQRCKQLLNKSSFPKTMTYLNEYKNHKETQKESLTKKYTRSQNGTIIKEIPNFNFLHAKNLEQLDSMKQKNKKQIKVEPFNFQQIKQKKKEQYKQQNMHENIKKRPQSANHSKFPEAKSTKKYDAYVNMVKKIKRQDEAKVQAQNAKTENYKQSHQQLTEIMKNRIAEELDKQPGSKNIYQPANPNKMKVNYEQIYLERPLLMKSKYAQYNLPWQTIF